MERFVPAMGPVNLTMDRLERPMERLELVLSYSKVKLGLHSEKSRGSDRESEWPRASGLHSGLEMQPPRLRPKPFFHRFQGLGYAPGMWRKLIACNVALCLISFSVVDGFKAVCKPLSQGTCLACSNCQYCVYCSQQGGQCTVCTKAKRP